MTSFLVEAELRKFKSQYIVRNWGTSSHRLFCVRKQNCWTLRHSIFLVRKRNCGLQITGYSLCGGRTARLKVKSLVWKWNCETSSHTKFIVWKRNCVTSKPQYFPYAEAELRHFRASSHTLFCMRKRNCGTLSLSTFLVRRRNFKSKNILCVEAELRNFKSHNSLCAEAEPSHIIVCMWNLSGFLCNNPKCPGAQGWRPLCQSHLGGAVLNCAILAVASTGIVIVCSVLIKHDRISWRVTRIRTLGKRHDRRPQGQSFLKGQYVETKATS